jgi:ATP-binding cassette subfamily B multidrug efflux pump
VAIIGKTGSGKSTIASLLCRLYEADSGEILIDDRPIETLNLADLRQQTGYVPQEVFLFSDTIANNIAFGVHSGKQDLPAIEKAAMDAAIYSNIIEFPDKFETIVGERGITLSGDKNNGSPLPGQLSKSRRYSFLMIVFLQLIQKRKKRS